MEKSVVVRETPDQRVVRLARVARERGIQVYQELSTGAWFATSASRPGHAHYLTAVSCTCEGFIFSGACTHNAALLDRLGWLPPVADAPETVACTFCKGTGRFWAEGDFSDSACGCCGERGWFYDIVIDRAPANVTNFPMTIVDQRPEFLPESGINSRLDFRPDSGRNPSPRLS
jgi:hypothetical protein